MNAAGLAVAWCAVQVAFVGVATIGAYWLVVRLYPAAGGFVATTGLALVFCLSAAAASPWPRWSFLDIQPSQRAPQEAQAPRGPLSILHELSRALGATSNLHATSRRLVTSHVGALPPKISGETSPPPGLGRILLAESRVAIWKDQPPRPGRRKWTGWLAVMFFFGFACAAAKLVLAIITVGVCRRRTRPVSDARLLALFTSLREPCRATRPVELREMRSSGLPATVGWRKPAILLPLDWRTWSDYERRAVLAHELAHVERGDYLLWLATQLALVLHFYHPAVHWLAAKIRLEQEFAADAAAATAVGSTRVYLAALARLALRSTEPTLGAVPSFVSSRGMLLQRIERLQRLDVQPSPVARAASKLVALSILLTSGIVAVGFRGEGAAQPPLPPPISANSPSEGAFVNFVIP